MGAGGLLLCHEGLGEPPADPSAPSSTQSSRYNPGRRAVLAPSGQQEISGQDWDLGGFFPMCQHLQMLWGVFYWISVVTPPINRGGQAARWLSCV